jgi:hypothetical protein
MLCFALVGMLHLTFEGLKKFTSQRSLVSSPSTPAAMGRLCGSVCASLGRLAPLDEAAGGDAAVERRRGSRLVASLEIKGETRRSHAGIMGAESVVEVVSSSR